MVIAVIDDEIEWIGKVLKEINSYSFDEETEVLSFQSAEEFLEVFPKTDIIISDIEMGELSGIRMMEEYRKSDSKAALIFLTSHSELAEYGYWVNAKRFVSKAKISERLPEAFDAIMEDRRANGAIIEIDMDGIGLVKFKQDAIIYIETSGRKTLIHLDNGKSAYAKTKISDLEGRLEESRFLRAHRSFIVNMKWISEIEKDAIVLKNGERILVTIKKVAEIKRRYTRYLFESATM